jgi:hypothetical protein
MSGFRPGHPWSSLAAAKTDPPIRSVAIWDGGTIIAWSNKEVILDV